MPPYEMANEIIVEISVVRSLLKCMKAANNQLMIAFVGLSNDRDWCNIAF
jgi:hypothetical protein